MQRIFLIAHNMRSTYNVGSLLRTADGLGVHHIYLTGYTPYPLQQDDSRLPHIAEKLQHQIHKTALGAESSVTWTAGEDVVTVIHNLQQSGVVCIALEQTPDATPLPKLRIEEDLALLLGPEVEGIPQAIADICDQRVVIPMFGKKESFNVVQAAAMALYHIRFFA